MKKIITGLLSFLFALEVLSPLPEKTSIKQILDNPDKFHQKEVLIEGKISNLQLKVSKAGNSYVTFLVSDNYNNSIKVFAWGHEKINQHNIKNGDEIEIRGIFMSVKYVGKYRFYNEIEAQDIKRLTNR
ncbi:MAG TPA: DUF3127 domain-containing protein [bacterium]|nr:DUF3127 domain-containing protein [bacterium]HPP30542.1 DUF3127 domain-containing protein [bacterium]